ncbi:ABC transporter substrate-binding protein [Cobetia sp. 5-11-6-3]|uniref:ABC transporter substrate-binding protein n=1 Tax=Cobetia sp. 5-11-6-3 TaxID=2737458 RepID=UPI001596874A|nr:ABC transporter substrate-binding protein [Cobetia sp. 5-11-6-3]
MTHSSHVFAVPALSRLRRGLVASLAVVLMGAAVSAEAREVQTAYGELELEGTPQRVVTLYEGALDVAVASEVTPLGAVTTRGGDGVASYLQSRVPEIEIVGTPREFNLEAIVALKPDMILAPPGLDKAQYQLMSRLAPTIVPGGAALSREAWKQQSRVYALALGEEAEAELEARLAAIDAHAARLKAEMTTPQTASLVRRMPGGLMAMSDELFATGLLAATGYQLVGGDLVKPGRPHSDPLSDENMARIDADTLFLATLDDSSEAAADALAKEPAFQRLEHASRDSLVGVNGQLWTSASGPLAAEALLKDIEQARSDG